MAAKLKYERLTREIIGEALLRGAKPKDIAKRVNLDSKVLYGIIYRYKLGVKHYMVEG